MPTTRSFSGRSVDTEIDDEFTVLLPRLKSATVLRLELLQNVDQTWMLLQTQRFAFPEIQA
jgi:hypothetical protein